MYVGLTLLNANMMRTQPPRTTIYAMQIYKNQTAASPTMEEVAAWFFNYCLFLFPVLFRRQVRGFFEVSVEILLVVVSDHP